MYDLKKLARLTWIEILKFWYRPIARVVLILMIVGPILGEILLAQISPRDAIYPRVTTFWFSADMLMFIALATVVLSILSLGNDFDLGTVRAILSRGVERFEFILSKIIATIIAALIFGFTFIGFALLSSIIAHLRISDIPLFDAAGGDLLFRALGAGSVIGLVNFVLSGIVMLALVLGRSSWIGMLGGIGSFFLDFFIGGIGSGSVFGVEDAYRYTITYHAVSILEKVFPSDQSISLPRAWAEQGFANPSQAILVLLLYGTGITFLTIFLFRRQDLLARS
jgi:ABC-type transport system involved in multi-copper enzyme maturation permease subunit